MRSQFQSLLSASPRLYCSILQILRKPFDVWNRNHMILFRRMMTMVWSMIRKHHTDYEIYMAIHGFLNEHLYVRPPNHEGLHRANCRVDDIIQRVACSSIDSIVDIGCSTGIITNQLARAYEVDRSRAYGIDVIPVERVDSRSFQYLNDIISIPDSSIQLVTMIMSLHHIPNSQDYIRQVARILKPGGWCVIKEHDVSSNDVEVHTYLDILHGLYSMSWCGTGLQEDPEFCDTFFADYNSKEEWTRRFNAVGLERVHDPTYHMAECDRKYEVIDKWWISYVRNVGYSYWAVYTKPDNAKEP